jgi:hypothetical protein
MNNKTFSQFYCILFVSLYFEFLLLIIILDHEISRDILYITQTSNNNGYTFPFNFGLTMYTFFNKKWYFVKIYNEYIIQ